MIEVESRVGNRRACHLLNLAGSWERPMAARWLAELKRRRNPQQLFPPDRNIEARSFS
jgi:hypothetical protein